VLTIDGSQGEGGGQILRTSLALSAITGNPVTITNIRANRAKPGLQRQHLVAVRAAARICNAELHGDELRSSEITMRPQGVVAGTYVFDIGSAGSASLVLQTILPPLLLADAPSRIIIDGGTHNPLAPPFEFLRDSFVPCLAKIGARVELHLERHGFYPAGGGRLLATIQPLRDPSPLELLTRGRPLSREIRAAVANLPLHIAEREADTARRKLQWSERETVVESIEGAAGPGNVLTITMSYQDVTEVVAAFGELRLPAEQVAARAVRDVRHYLKSTAPVGEHLADQLLVPLSIARGGSFRAVTSSLHLQTNCAVIAAFLGPVIEVVPAENDALIRVRSFSGWNGISSLP
jgi:RNA 3'-terminal phosphate cyclase (ATP)